MNIVIARITKTSAIFSAFVLFIGILNGMISPSSFIIGEVQAQKVEESIANLQPIISAYYDSTRYVIAKQYSSLDQKEYSDTF